MRAACCCPHHAANADCKCPVCTDLREMRSGKPYFKSCGQSAEPVALPKRLQTTQRIILQGEIPSPVSPPSVKTP